MKKKRFILIGIINGIIVLSTLKEMFFSDAPSDFFGLFLIGVITFLILLNGYAIIIHLLSKNENKDSSIEFLFYFLLFMPIGLIFLLIIL